jgi:G:T-mismatch repair DNA endonuclease (very short patch repair protein)
MSGKVWSMVELDFLRRVYPEGGIAAFLEGFPTCSRKRAYDKLFHLGLLSVQLRRWSKTEVECLRKVYPIWGKESFRYFKNRSKNAVSVMAVKVGLKILHSRWNKAEEGLIIKSYSKLGAAYVHSLIPYRSVECIHVRARKLGIRFERHWWSDEEVDYLKKTFSRFGAKLFIKRFPFRSDKAANAYALKILGLRREKIPIVNMKQEAYLRKTYYKYGTERFLLRYSGFGRQQVVGIANRMGLRVTCGRFWNDGDIRILKVNYPKGGVAGAKHVLPWKGENQIKHMACVLGLEYALRSRHFSVAEIKLLRRTYHRFGTGVFLSHYPQRSAAVVYFKARELGLSCPYKFHLTHKRPNLFEKKVMRLLDDNFPREWRYVGNGRKYINGRFPDFVHRRKNIVLLANGLYWHTTRIGIPDVKSAERREREDYRKAGYKVIFIWDFELKNSMDVVSKIVGVCNA